MLCEQPARTASPWPHSRGGMGFIGPVPHRVQLVHRPVDRRTVLRLEVREGVAQVALPQGCLVAFGEQELPETEARNTVV